MDEYAVYVPYGSSSEFFSIIKKRSGTNHWTGYMTGINDLKAAQRMVDLLNSDEKSRYNG